MKTSKDNPEVAAIYCPLWHNYDHAASWKGEGWCEWELVKNAKPRFKGHRQPYKPTWGYFDESIVVGNTPAKFKRLCEYALDFTRKNKTSPNAVVVNAWNEWTESSFLLPEKRYGTAYLEAIYKTFKKNLKERKASVT